ncbi:MAG TPA: maltose alpha-D-glucosyltransferase [Candidatus Limnocylindrales bacterium]|nr:maltose alpha-D-glucosyltransferase [Candidatus Limnocylindrales bacterium]
MAKRHASATDPLWYKDAIIYELHVRAFKDSNSDGIGDFPGLLEKLDYLQDLGVTCLWLLPFFPSPLKDDGYDISDYLNVHPMYGTLQDFQNVLNAAHDRGLQVIIELVINHTSDQHPWFQAARLAPAGSPERDFYVWSDTNQKYRDARIIFTDTEKSNWTWDPAAKAYYWHRFFSHQPDLNYDSPRVIEEVLKVMRFWLDMGVDGLRVDAVPYLVEREGTICENLPETHAVIKILRHEIDTNYPGRMLLAEANQWPTDVRPYFGDGDEFHMAFHFPLMPRIYMALRQEDRLPITDIIAQTPSIPDTCQWALFLRNHDELTLEMVTNDERDYMYLAYSADPRMRLNLGIRRRLAPLVDNNRRRIELLISLLFSFPGAPILYYGDEIGMGDNIYLGDRNGVRTPMQWNGDRNAGFSNASPARLYSPVIMDPVWGYQAINVEAQQSDPSSLLTWMRNMIALRKLFRVFGRGSIEFLDSANRKVLAYLRTEGDDHVLCVANLSRFAQPVDLDLSKMEGMLPIEMLGYVEFPAITQQPYRVTLAPYGFLWLELHAKPEMASVSADQTEHSPLILADDWRSILEGSERRSFELIYLLEYLPKQRWFAAKSRQIKATRVLDWAVLETWKSALAIVEVQYAAGPSDVYLLPLGATLDEQAAEELRHSNPNSIIAPIFVRGVSGLLHDALFDDSTCQAVLSLIESGKEIQTRNGTIRGVPGAALRPILDASELPLQVRRTSAEQSNTSILYGDRLILKLFRRLEEGVNPDCEIGKYLTEKAGFDRIPPFAGSIEYAPTGNGSAMTLAMLQGLVVNEGDGWKWTIEELDRYYEMSSPQPFPQDSGEPADIFELVDRPLSQLARDHVGIYLDAAATLGRRTAEMHLALASPTDNPAFAPEPLAGKDLETLVAEVRQNASTAFEVLRERVPHLADEVIETAASVLTRRKRILDKMEMTGNASAIRAQKTRIHGDYHLGQLLRVKTDFVILDFEGEPSRSLDYRRSKQSPLKDVAGMIRSFSYAAYASLINYVARHPDAYAKLEPWAKLWERSVSAEFLRAYWQTCEAAEFVPPAASDRRWLLEIFLLDKVLYELLYELNSRPAWVRIPLIGISSLQS